MNEYTVLLEMKFQVQKRPLYCVIGGTCSNKSGLFKCVL